jgi:hypothetical protein
MNKFTFNKKRLYSMNKKYFLCALILSATLNPIFAHERRSSDGREERRVPTVFEAVGLGAFIGGLWWLFSGEAPRKEEPNVQAPRPVVSKPIQQPSAYKENLKKQEEKVINELLAVIDETEKNGLEGYLSEAQQQNRYMIFLQENQQKFINAARNIEGYVRLAIPSECSDQREFHAKRVRLVIDDFKKAIKNSQNKYSQRKIDKDLADWDAGVIQPDKFANPLLEIIQQVKFVAC